MPNIYTVENVNALVTEGTDDLEEAIDFHKAIMEVSYPQMIYLSERYLGATAKEAMDTAGVSGNSTRFHEEAVGRLTKVLNGEDWDGEEDSTDGSGAIRGSDDTSGVPC